MHSMMYDFNTHPGPHSLSKNRYKEPVMLNMEVRNSYRLSLSCVNRQRRVKCTAERKDIEQVHLSDLAFCTYSY